jgi:hypothetical protein
LFKFNWGRQFLLELPFFLYIRFLKITIIKIIMDSTKAQAAVDTAQTAVNADNAQLETDTAALTEAQTALSNITFINQLEGLSADQVASINEILAADTDNKLGITLALPPAAE